MSTAKCEVQHSPELLHCISSADVQQADSHALQAGRLAGRQAGVGRRAEARPHQGSEQGKQGGGPAPGGAPGAGRHLIEQQAQGQQQARPGRQQGPPHLERRRLDVPQRRVEQGRGLGPCVGHAQHCLRGRGAGRGAGQRAQRPEPGGRLGFPQRGPVWGCLPPDQVQLLRGGCARLLAGLECAGC